MNLVSIIIPAYNAENFIEQTIRSVKSQTHANWELLIVDDGSRDNTEAKIKPFLVDTRIRYIHKKNEGVSIARNTGIEKASGDFIAFLDADDVWMENNLEIKLNFLNDSSLDFVFADMFICDKNMEILRKGEPGTDCEMVKNILLWEREVIPAPSGNLLIRKKCFSSGLRFDVNLSTAADQDFSIYLANDFRGKYINEPLLYYRTHPDNMSKNIKRMESDHIAVYNKAVKNGLLNDTVFRIRCYSNLFLILSGSYWKDADDKFRSIVYLFHALVWYPPNILKLMKKFLK